MIQGLQDGDIVYVKLVNSEVFVGNVAERDSTVLVCTDVQFVCDLDLRLSVLGPLSGQESTVSGNSGCDHSVGKRLWSVEIPVVIVPWANVLYVQPQIELPSESK